MPDLDTLLRDLDPDIRKLAENWSRDCPYECEDIAQEARLAVAEVFRLNPDAPRTHLFRRAKHEILDYRKRGKSVDNKLDKTYKRHLVWGLLSLDKQPVYALADLSSLYLRPWQKNGVEEAAIANVSYADLRARLTDTEDRYLCFKLQGYSGKEARTLLGITAYAEKYLKNSIRSKAADVLLADW